MNTESAESTPSTRIDTASARVQHTELAPYHNHVQRSRSLTVFAMGLTATVFLVASIIASFLAFVTADSVGQRVNTNSAKLDATISVLTELRASDLASMQMRASLSADLHDLRSEIRMLRNDNARLQNRIQELSRDCVRAYTREDNPEVPARSRERE